MSSPKRILVVEDDEDFATLVESRLKARHYEVDVTAGLEQAHKLLAHTPPDMVLLGLGIWKRHGAELCQRIHGSLGASTTPVLLMAGEEEITSLIMSLEQGIDDFILKPFSTFELQLRVALNFHRNEERLQANPLTKLPGNVAIDKEIRSRIEQNRIFSVCYMDIDNFKAFNDRYGFDRGDDVLLQTSNIIRRVAGRLDREADLFLGHIGGDDFLILLNPKYDELFAKDCIAEFDRLIPTYYNEEDLRVGSVTVKNRKGKTTRVALMSLSIACVSNEHRRLDGPAQIGHIAAEVKKYLKTQEGSNFLKDRRAEPLRDFDAALNVLQAPKEESPRVGGEPLGQILVAAGIINREQLDRALEHHFKTGQRLGQILIQMKLCRAEDIGRMLERKLGVHYISLAAQRISADMARQFTGEYVRTHRVCPIKLEQKHLYLAMLDPFDVRTIDDIERITGYKVVPCLALEQEFESFLERNFSEAHAAGRIRSTQR